jgi:hypothetical protein
MTAASTRPVPTPWSILTICFPADLAPRISYQIQVISPDPDLNADPTRRLPTAA